jgi:hypothetical protein
MDNCKCLFSARIINVTQERIKRKSEKRSLIVRSEKMERVGDR